MPGGDGDPFRNPLIDALPVDAAFAGLGHVGENGVTLDGMHGVGVGPSGRARGHPEEAVLGVDGTQATYRWG